MTNKITFKDNPWKNGHRVLKFIWSGHINEDGLWFDLHLESADYDEENNELDSQDDEEVSKWRAKIVWNNYHRWYAIINLLGRSKWISGGDRAKSI